MMGTTETSRVKGRYRPFCFSVKGHVKLLRLGVTVTSMAFFIIAKAPEPYIVVTGFEVTVVSFFIILYIFRLDQLMNWLFWPLLDIINSLVTTLFMVIISVLALLPETTTLTILGGDVMNSFISTIFLLVVAMMTIQEKGRRHLFYVGGNLCLIAAILCCLDALGVIRRMRRMKEPQTKASSKTLLKMN
ncbi:chemokine-like factor isoform X4 [Dipodomys merriami]|uniref:chemokine-like factor isoform X4 n=1 Tax=Dipodomys merriami TaxID=94247 RepID=UPI00385571CB